MWTAEKRKKPSHAAALCSLCGRELLCGCVALCACACRLPRLRRAALRLARFVLPLARLAHARACTGRHKRRLSWAFLVVCSLLGLGCGRCCAAVFSVRLGLGQVRRSALCTGLSQLSAVSLSPLCLCVVCAGAWLLLFPFLYLFACVRAMVLCVVSVLLCSVCFCACVPPVAV
jgi:hypothetical protein